MPKRNVAARAPQELVDGYQVAADLAQRRQERAILGGDKREASAWGRIASYCRMMAAGRYVDAPESQVAYVAPAEEIVLNLRVLDRILDRDSDEAGDRWTVEKQMALAAALLILSSTERVIAQMHYGGMLDVVQIAKAMKVTSNTVETYLDRIRKKWSRLRKEINSPTKSDG